MTDRTEADLLAALGKLPSGCSVLTARGDGQDMGILASWIQQASFEPPMVTLALRHDRPILKLILASGRFVLNLIGDGQQKTFFTHFGKADQDDIFDGLACHRVDSGVILEDALGYLECRLGPSLRAGDHEILAAEIISGGLKDAGEPYVHVRKSAATY